MPKARRVTKGCRVAGSRNAILLVAVGLTCGLLLLHPPQFTSAEYLSYALRVTAYLSFAFFILAYVAQPIRQLFGGTRWLVRNRRYLGLAAAFAHTIHFGYVAVYVAADVEAVDAATLVLGGLAFALYWLMAATSNNASQRLLGSWWGRLHTFGMHYIWIVYAVTFSGGVGSSIFSTLFFIDCLLALGLRIWAGARRRASQAKAGEPTANC